MLALLPEYDGQGVGKTVLDMVASFLKTLGHARLFLGWRSTGALNDAGDEVLEYQY